MAIYEMHSMMRHTRKTTAYSLVETQLRDELATRRYAVGDRLPTVRELAQRHQCSLTTIQKALGSLQREGVLESRNRKGLFVRAFPATGRNRGRVVCLIPKWDSLQRESFAAQYVLGVTSSAAESGYAVETIPYAYDDTDKIGQVAARVHRDRYAGLLWANPVDLRTLAQLEATGVRVVTSVRYFPMVNVPRTVDNYPTGYVEVAKILLRHGVKRLAIVCGGTLDQTYEPAVQALRQAMAAAGIEIPEGTLCRARCDGLASEDRRVLIRNLVAQRDRWDACWTVAPDALERLFEVIHQEGIDLGNRLLGVQTAKAVPVAGAHIVLETDVQAHGREAFRLLHEWLETGRRPQEVRLPMVCREVAHP